jgi:hypothetical protein
MPGMRVRRFLLPAAVVAGSLAVAAPAPARIVEIGKTAEEPVPSCPARPCQAMTRTTGYQAKIGDDRGPMVVPADGKIVAWTVTLSRPGKTQRKFFNDNFGGAASAGITVLRPGKKLFSRVTGKSGVQALEPYFGQTVQFPLGRALNVRKGYVIALTVPTWAPVLSLGLPAETSWRAARVLDDNGCNKLTSQTAQMILGRLTQYRCLYKTARLTYTATLITSPKKPSR